MIQKLELQSIIDKYYLKVNEEVIWVIKDNVFEVNFMSPTRDVIGKVITKNFQMEDCELCIFDTKKLQSLINICNNDLLFKIDKQGKYYNKLQISDSNFNLTYALSDPLVISKVNNVNVPEWEATLHLAI